MFQLHFVIAIFRVITIKFIYRVTKVDNAESGDKKHRLVLPNKGHKKTQLDRTT